MVFKWISATKLPPFQKSFTTNDPQISLRRCIWTLDCPTLTYHRAQTTDKNFQSAAYCIQQSMDLPYASALHNIIYISRQGNIYFKPSAKPADLPNTITQPNIKNAMFNVL